MNAKAKVVFALLGLSVIFWITLIIFSTTNPSKQPPEKPDLSLAQQIEKDFQKSTGLCKFRRNNDDLGFSPTTEATTEFINLGRKLFSGNKCKSFKYVLTGTLVNGRGNEIEAKLIEFKVGKKKFNQYNWDNLKGQELATNLLLDGILQYTQDDIDLSKIKYIGK